MDDGEVSRDPVHREESAARIAAGTSSDSRRTTASQQPPDAAEEPPQGSPPPDDLLSPLGEVQTRTRSARKKRKQEQEQEQQNQPSSSDAKEPEGDDDNEPEEHDEPRKKRARLAAAGAEKGETTSPPSGRARVFDDDYEGEEDNSQDDDDAMGSSSEGGDEAKGDDGGNADDAKPAAVETAPRPAAAVAAAQMKLDGNRQLRIPAHQTPGKVVATSTSAVVGRMRVAAAAAASRPNEDPLGRRSDALPAPSRRRFEFGTTVTTASAAQAARLPAPSVTLKPPPASSPVQTSGSPGEVHEGFKNVRQLLDAALGQFVNVILPHPAFWFLLLGLPLYLVGAMPWVSSVANRTVRYIQPQPMPASLPLANQTLLNRLAELEQIHENLQQDLWHKREEIEHDVRLFMDERAGLVAAVQEHAAALQHKVDEVSDAIRDARAHPLAHEHDLTVDQIATQDIQTLQSLVRGAIVDVSFLSSWQSLPTVEEMSCPISSSADAVVVSEELRGAVVAALRTKAQQLKLAATVSAIEIMGNKSLEETYRKWIRQEVLEYEDEDGVVPIGTDTYEHLVERNQRMVQALPATPGSTVPGAQAAGGPSEGAIQRIIDARMEVERADQTGRMDYASVLNGAAVIRGGERGTSPSLVDQLPLANRLARLWSIRNYGHGPVAALTPTNPPFTALGKCWSFAKDRSPAKQSGYATLTLQLAKPVRVRAFSVEHPPQDVTDRIQTAMQNFRVVGYEFPNAQGMAWPLGSFEYRVGGDIRQEFAAKTEVKGEPVPVLQSLSLLIDSNWGANYTCLYRFRVFGDEV